jgi:hypothetical protein
LQALLGHIEVQPRRRDQPLASALRCYAIKAILPPLLSKTTLVASSPRFSPAKQVFGAPEPRREQKTSNAHRTGEIGMFESLGNAARIKLAKDKMPRVLDHFLYLLELHANNAHVVYSSLLSSQIPQSYGANAFNIFRRSMHQFEIVRLCALWDSADLAKENIPTVIELIDDATIIDVFADEIRSQRANDAIILLNPSVEPTLNAAERNAVRQSELAFAEDQADTARSELRRAIDQARVIVASPRLASIMNIRDKHLAHSLEKTRREKQGPVAPMMYGDETGVLDLSVPIVEQLYCWVNQKSFSLDEARRIDSENATSLWRGCKFDSNMN